MFEKPKIFLCTLGADNYAKRLSGIIKRAGKGRKIIYVTTTKPFFALSGILKSAGIRQESIFFIDCVSKSVGEKATESKNCVFLESPRNLTAISIAINESVKRFPGKKLLVVDSLSTLLLYNDAVTMGRFSNFVINRMRTLDVSAIISAFESDANSTVIRQVSSFVDEVVKK